MYIIIFWYTCILGKCGSYLRQARFFLCRAQEPNMDFLYHSYPFWRISRIHDVTSIHFSNLSEDINVPLSLRKASQIRLYYSLYLLK